MSQPTQTKPATPNSQNNQNRPSQRSKKQWAKDIGQMSIRIVVGGFFTVFGIGKAIAPLAEFNESVENYQLLPEAIIPYLTPILIFFEIAFGLLLLFGLFTRLSAMAVAGMLVMFMLFIGQTIVRGIPLEDCGCSGGLINIGDTPTDVITRDLFMFVGMLWLLTMRSFRWSVDSLFERKS